MLESRKQFEDIEGGTGRSEARKARRRARFDDDPGALRVAPWQAVLLRGEGASGDLLLQGSRRRRKGRPRRCSEKRAP